MWLYRTSGDVNSQIILYEYQPDRKAERSVKPFVIGRKNFLFANTARGVQASAVMYSLVKTAKENGIAPYAYSAWLLKTAPELELSEHSQRAEQLLSVYFQ